MSLKKKKNKLFLTAFQSFRKNKKYTKQKIVIFNLWGEKVEGWGKSQLETNLSKDMDFWLKKNLEAGEIPS